MCSICDQTAAKNSLEERHQLIRLEEQMARHHLSWLEIQHRVISLEARLVAEASKPESEQDIVEMARLSRNLSAAKLDQDNVILNQAKVAAEMKRFTDAAKKAKTSPFAGFMEEAGLTPLSPDDPMYGLITGLLGDLASDPRLAGLAFGQPMRGNPGRGGFSPTAGPGFGFPM